MSSSSKNTVNLLKTWKQSQWRRHIIVSVLSLISIVIFGGAGYILDSIYLTSPRYLIIGIVVSFLLTQVIIFRYIKVLIRLIP